MNYAFTIQKYKTTRYIYIKVISESHIYNTHNYNNTLKLLQTKSTLAIIQIYFIGSDWIEFILLKLKTENTVAK